MMGRNFKIHQHSLLKHLVCSTMSLYFSSNNIEQNNNNNTFIPFSQFREQYIDTSKWEYAPIPPDLTVINFKDNKYYQNSQKSVDGVKNYYWLCSDPKCDIRLITRLYSTISYPQWAKYGYLTKETINKHLSIKHHHEPTWSNDHALRKWGTNQMIMDYLSEDTLKPTAIMRQFQLRYPERSQVFANININKLPMYRSKFELHPKLPKNIDEIEHICTKTTYGITYFSQKHLHPSSLIQTQSQKIKNLFENHHLPYHSESNSNSIISQSNAITQKIWELKQEKHHLLMKLSSDINPLYYSDIYLGKTDDHCFIFQSEHASYRMQESERLDADGTFPPTKISPLAPTGQHLFKQVLFFNTHTYAPSTEYTPKVLDNIMVLCTSKKKNLISKNCRCYCCQKQRKKI